MPDDEMIKALNQSLLNEKETDTLVLAFAKGRAQRKGGKQSFSAEEANAIYSAAKYIRLSNLYLNLVLDGAIYMDLDDEGDIIWIYPEEEANA